MKIKTIIGLALMVIGATVVPFGHWVNRIYYMLGSPVYWLGLRSRLVLIALVKTRLVVLVPKTIQEYQLSERPEAFAAREYFESPMTGGAGDASGD